MQQDLLKEPAALLDLVLQQALGCEVEHQILNSSWPEYLCLHIDGLCALELGHIDELLKFQDHALECSQTMFWTTLVESLTFWHLLIHILVQESLGATNIH